MTKPTPKPDDGITLRDWMAGMYLSGYVSGSIERGASPQADFAARAYEAADAMLKERERK